MAFRSLQMGSISFENLQKCQLSFHESLFSIYQLKIRRSRKSLPLTPPHAECSSTISQEISHR